MIIVFLEHEHIGIAPFLWCSNN